MRRSVDEDGKRRAGVAGIAPLQRGGSAASERSCPCRRASSARTTVEAGWSRRASQRMARLWRRADDPSPPRHVNRPHQPSAGARLRRADVGAHAARRLQVERRQLGQDIDDCRALAARRSRAPARPARHSKRTTPGQRARVNSPISARQRVDTRSQSAPSACFRYVLWWLPRRRYLRLATRICSKDNELDFLAMRLTTGQPTVFGVWRDPDRRVAVGRAWQRLRRSDHRRRSARRPLRRQPRSFGQDTTPGEDLVGSDFADHLVGGDFADLFGGRGQRHP